MTSAIIGGDATNIIHRWMHMEYPPYLALILQQTGLILTKNHGHHRTSGFERTYCITTGWMDLIVDAKWVWVRVERLLGGDH